MEKYNCEHCNKEFESKIGLGVHKKQHCKLYKEYKLKEEKEFKYICVCNKKFETLNSLKAHRAKCKKYREIVNEERKILTKDFLYQNLIINDFTASHIVRLFNFKYTYACNLISLAKKFGIKTKTISESKKNKITKDKYEQTCLKKYGDKNVLGKNSFIYEKRNKTIKEKYNVNNVFQLESVKEKLKNTLLKKYGVTSPVYIKDRYKNCGRKSKEHKKIENLLNELNILYESEKVMDFYKNGYNPRPDIIISDKNLIIEIYGNYFHADPSIYKNNDIINRWHGPMKAIDIRKKDEERINQIKEFGYNVEILWCSDIKNIKKEDIWNILK